jgi:integrase
MNHHAYDLTFLHEATVLPATLRKYRSGVRRFQHWAKAEGIQARTVRELDRALDQYMHSLYLEGGGKGRSAAKCALFGVLKFFPRAKGRLPRSAAALKGWARLVPPRRYPPMPWAVAIVLALTMTICGYFCDAVSLLLSFRCYLRVGEMSSLRCRDVVVSQRRNRISLRLKKTKTGENQWVEVRDHGVRRLLLVWLRHRHGRKNDLVFQTTPARFRGLLERFCSAIGVQRFTPHSLRHGGATYDYTAGTPLADLMTHGRWALESSARHYVQTGRALLLDMELDTHVVQITEDLGDNLVDILIFCFRSRSVTE